MSEMSHGAVTGMHGLGGQCRKVFVSLDNISDRSLMHHVSL